MISGSKVFIRRVVKPLAFLISLLIWGLSGFMPAGVQPAYSQGGSNLSLRTYGMEPALSTGWKFPSTPRCPQILAIISHWNGG